MLLAAGFMLGFSKSPRTHAKIWKSLPKVWKEIGRITLRRIIKEFKYKRLVDFKEEKDGTVSVVLTKLGQHHALKYNPEKIKISIPTKWDGKWRVVIFDIKEKRRGVRNKLRAELQNIGFVRLQHSVWVFPYECEEFLIMLKADVRIGKDVLYLVSEHVENDAHLKKIFNLD